MKPNKGNYVLTRELHKLLIIVGGILMKKILMLFLISVVLLSGCNKDAVKVDSTKEDIEPKENPTTSIVDLNGVAKHYKDNGFEVIIGDKMFFTMVGAIDGESWTIEDTKVEIYDYQKESESRANVEVFREQLGDQGAVISNGKFLLVVYSPVTDNIIDNFKKLK